MRFIVVLSLLVSGCATLELDKNPIPPEVEYKPCIWVTCLFGPFKQKVRRRF